MSPKRATRFFLLLTPDKPMADQEQSFEANKEEPWFSGQSSCLLLQWSELESRRLLNFMNCKKTNDNYLIKRCCQM